MSSGCPLGGPPGGPLGGLDPETATEIDTPQKTSTDRSTGQFTLDILGWPWDDPRIAQDGTRIAPGGLQDYLRCPPDGRRIGAFHFEIPIDLARQGCLKATLGAF